MYFRKSHSRTAKHPSLPKSLLLDSKQEEKAHEPSTSKTLSVLLNRQTQAGEHIRSSRSVFVWWGGKQKAREPSTIETILVVLYIRKREPEGIYNHLIRSPNQRRTRDIFKHSSRWTTEVEDMTRLAAGFFFSTDGEWDEAARKTWKCWCSWSEGISKARQRETIDTTREENTCTKASAYSEEKIERRESCPPSSPMASLRKTSKRGIFANRGARLSPHAPKQTRTWAVAGEEEEQARPDIRLSFFLWFCFGLVGRECRNIGRLGAAFVFGWWVRGEKTWGVYSAVRVWGAGRRQDIPRPWKSFLLDGRQSGTLGTFYRILEKKQRQDIIHGGNAFGTKHRLCVDEEKKSAGRRQVYIHLPRTNAH